MFVSLHSHQFVKPSAFVYDSCWQVFWFASVGVVEDHFGVTIRCYCYWNEWRSSKVVCRGKVSLFITFGVTTKSFNNCRFSLFEVKCMRVECIWIRNTAWHLTQECQCVRADMSVSKASRIIQPQEPLSPSSDLSYYVMYNYLINHHCLLHCRTIFFVF